MVVQPMHTSHLCDCTEHVVHADRAVLCCVVLQLGAHHFSVPGELPHRAAVLLGVQLQVRGQQEGRVGGLLGTSLVTATGPPCCLLSAWVVPINLGPTKCGGLPIDVARPLQLLLWTLARDTMTLAGSNRVRLGGHS
jgi:hypothetical protein